MENNITRTKLPNLTGKKIEDKIELTSITITSLEDEINEDEQIIKEKKKVLKEWNKKHENLNLKLKESDKQKRLESLLEVCTPEEKEVIEKVFKLEEAKEEETSEQK